MFWKLLLLCLCCSRSLGQWNWDEDEMGDGGKAGNDFIIEKSFDDSVEVKTPKDSDSDEDGGKYPFRGNDKDEENNGKYPSFKKLPKCSEYKYYGGLCTVQGYQSMKCPRKPCAYYTKEATTVIIGGTRITVELSKTYNKVGSECEKLKGCKENCACSTIWCKVPEKKMAKINGKEYKMVWVFIPYPCGCQCRWKPDKGRSWMVGK